MTEITLGMSCRRFFTNDLHHPSSVICQIDCKGFPILTASHLGMDEWGREGQRRMINRWYGKEMHLECAIS